MANIQIKNQTNAPFIKGLPVREKWRRFQIARNVYYYLLVSATKYLRKN